MHKQKQAFTLVELIVVITILAILGTIAIMAFSGYSKNTRDSARISDIGNMKKSLELWILQSGTYPDPSSGTGVTYSGAMVWSQGTFGDSVTSTVGKLDKKPVDPLYEVEYTYSVTNSKKEYQIGAVLEKDMASNVIFPQTYAATSGEAYVSGTYNGILTTVGMNPTYILALPSIILSDINSAELKGTVSRLVYEGKTNLPSSYKVTGLTMTGSSFSFSPTVVWSGSSLTELNTQTGFQNMVKNLQEVYTSNSVFGSSPEYTSIVTGDSTPSVTTMSFVKDLVQTNTSTELSNIATTYISYAVNGVCGTANGQTLGEGNTITGSGACSIGTASIVSGEGPWTWSCSGTNGGTNASCSANKTVVCNVGETIQSGQCKDPDWNSVVSLLHFDGNITDEKGLIWTSYGSAAADVTGKFGNALSLNGIVKYLNLTNTSEVQLGTDNYTIEYWMYYEGATSGYYDNPFSYHNGSTTLRVVFGDGGYGNSFMLQTPAQLSTTSHTRTSLRNNWNHVAVVRATDITKLYVNGVQAASLPNTYNITGYSSLIIGAIYGVTQFYNGRIDEFRITKGVARYTSTFTPPTQAFPNQ